MSESYDAPLLAEWERRMDKEIEAVEQDLKTGRNISNYEQYRAKVKEREGLLKGKAVMQQLIKDARKGDLEL